MVDPDDLVAVEALLGRPPAGAFEVVVRHADGSPLVIANAPLLDDGTPMPTRYWLVGEPERARVGRLESEGGVNRSEAEVDAAELDAAAHGATPPSATPSSPDPHRPPTLGRRGRHPRAGSSACTPTTPGTWRAATTRSGRWVAARLDPPGPGAGGPYDPADHLPDHQEPTPP